MANDLRRPPLAAKLDDWVWKEWLNSVYNKIVEIVTTAGGAPVDATYITVTNNTTLTDERRLAAGTGISIVDNGANSTIVISAPSSGLFDWGKYIAGRSGFRYG